MDEKEVEQKLGHKWITDKQLCDAMEYVRGFYKMHGENPYAIEWFQEKPKWIPKDVSTAWDTVVQRADDEATLGISV